MNTPIPTPRLGGNVSGYVSLLIDGDVMDTKEFDKSAALYWAIDDLIEDWTGLKGEFSPVEYDELTANLSGIIAAEYRNAESSGTEIVDIKNRLHLTVDFV